MSEEIIEEVEIKEKENIFNNYSLRDELIKDEEFTKKDFNNIFLATATRELIGKFAKVIDSLDLKDYNKKYTKKEKQALFTNYTTMSKTNVDDLLINNINNGKYVNDIKYGSGNLNMRHIKVKKSGVMSGNMALTKLNSALSIGVPSHVALWHSGFWVTLSPGTDSEIIALDAAIASNEVKLGRETNTLIYSNASIIYTRLVLEFISRHITATSVVIPEGTDVMDIIKIQDLNTLVIGIIASMYPDGYGVTRSCINSLIMENEKPLCDFVVSSRATPLEMLKIDRDSFSPSVLLHMSKHRPNSIELEEVIEYQRTFSANNSKVIRVETSNDISLDLTLSSPSLSEYIDNGELWISNLIQKGEALFTKADTKEDKNLKITNLVKTVILGVYNIFVTEIKIIDNKDTSTIVDRATINEAINSISSDDETVKVFMKKVKDYIELSTISIVATKSYICPKCQKANINETIKKEFREYLPVNMLENFFDLGVLKISKVKGRNTY